MSLPGSYTCPHCEKTSYCNCSECKKHLTKDHTVAIRHDEWITCPYCKKDYSYDQALDMEYKQNS